LARSLGYRAKACIHPDQVSAVNSVFAAGRDLDWARKVVRSYEAGVREGAGAVLVDGEMVDLAVVARARALLARAGNS
jgi:citrate lyase subunit beta/citryl-CoA lyase